MLYSLCYPELSVEDNEFIKSFRDKYDLPYKDVVSHHFTIAFGISELSQDLYSEHIKQQVMGMLQINFTCRYAMLGNDDSNDNYYVFLVPDEGYSQISLLHDRLYQGILEPFHRLEIPYIPHIGIATLKDANEAKNLCSELNSSGLNITGSISGITLCEYNGKVIEDLDYFEF